MATEIENQEENIVVAQFDKNATDEIRLSLRVFKGRRYCDLRLFTSANVDGDAAVPTKKGLMLGIDLLPQLKRSIDALYDRALRDGWIE
jgi:hypothetical protein